MTKLAVPALAASVVLGGSFSLPAHALPSSFTRYILNYTTTQGAGSLNGYIDIDITNPQATTIYTGTPFPVWVGGLTLNYNNGISTSTYQKSDFNAFYWSPNSPSVNWSSSLTGQFLDINFGNAGESASPVNALAFLAMSTDDDLNVYLLTSATLAVPGPIPLLGAVSAYGWARHIRRRSRLTSKASA